MEASGRGSGDGVWCQVGWQSPDSGPDLLLFLLRTLLTYPRCVGLGNTDSLSLRPNSKSYRARRSASGAGGCLSCDLGLPCKLMEREMRGGKWCCLPDPAKDELSKGRVRSAAFPEAPPPQGGRGGASPGLMQTSLLLRLRQQRLLRGWGTVEDLPQVLFALAQ